MTRAKTFLSLAFAVAVLAPGCGDAADDGDAGADAGTDADADADTDSDSDTDTDSDSDTDADTDSDSDSDTDTDADTDWDTACTVGLSGECVDLVAGCAWCPDGASVWPENMDCGDTSWCCVPEVDPSNGCQTAGGVCGIGACPTG